MAYVILSNRPGQGDVVVANLADGVHPGTKVVEDPNTVTGWNSRPNNNFRSVHSPGSPTAAFDDFMETNVDDLTGDTLRLLAVNFLPPQAAEIAQNRTLTVVNPNALLRKANPALGP